MTHNALPPNNLTTGFRYLTQGIGVLLQPGMKRFVLIPVVANCIVFLILTIALFQNFSELKQGFIGFFPDWAWLSYIVTFFTAMFIFLTLLIYGYSFTLLTNIIAAPFYGMMAEKIEHRITGQELPSESLGSMVARTLRREMVKLFYFLSRGLLVMIGLFFLSPIPLINFLVPFLALLWGTWVMTLQYIDYPADNNQLSFTALRSRLKSQRLSSASFGGIIMLASMTPIVNIVIMPLAVAGGTLFWINELQQNTLETNIIQNHHHQ